jgi:HlyD family secretion protein
VLKVEPQAVVEQNVTMFAVLVSIQNPDGLLLPGMNAEVEVSIARSENVLTIPVMALRTGRDIASTAQILGRSEDEIMAALGDASEQGTPRKVPKNNGSQAQRGARKGSTDYRFGGEFWVVMDNASQEVRKVRTGVTDLDRVEIISGLDEVDKVLVLPSSHLVETQQDLQNFINRRIGGVPGISR